MKGLRLKDVCTKIGSGATPRGGKDVYLETGEIALIRSQNVYNDHFERNGIVYIEKKHADQLKNVQVEKNDILLNITGDSVARACQVPDAVLPARVNQHVAIIRPDPDRLDPKFLRFFLISPEMQSHMLSLAAAGATRNALTKGMIEGFRVPDFSIEEQREIGLILGELENKIELNRRMNETLEAMARAIFKDWFVDFGPTRAKAEGREPYLSPELWNLFPDALDDEDKPVGWKQGTLADIADSPRCGVSPSNVSEDTPYIGLEHMPRRSIALTEWEGAGKVTSNKSVFKKGEFLFGKLRPYFHKVGIAPLDGICSTDIVVVIPRGPEWAAFTLACLSSDEFVEYTDQTSTGTKMPRTSWRTMGQYKICLPSERGARAFQSLIQPLLNRIDANIHEARTLAQTRDLLLPKLMSGEIRLKDAEKSVEAVA
ncbi:restriction endonuclease subunit S [Thiolapillus sp.]|uniref:restriction endonuclease subunit S n=1 Tax=Thiolapillus sp. TaxID=2017437 RepID=UPI0025E9EEFD|nr:restriction endonuclease subunit S [Thiolapillus sp.]